MRKRVRAWLTCQIRRSVARQLRWMQWCGATVRLGRRPPSPGM